MGRMVRNQMAKNQMAGNQMAGEQRGWAALAADLLDVVAPRDCVSCQRPGRILCPECRGVFAGLAPWTDSERVGVPVSVGGAFSGVLGDALRAYKADRNGVRGLAQPLTEVFLPAVRQAVSRAAGSDGRGLRRTRQVAIVSIPASRRAHWVRGEDILGRVVAGVADELNREGWPVRRWSLLEPGRAVADQRGLSAQRRRVNVTGSMRVAPRELLRWSRAGQGGVVIVDDVLTTGATLREAVRVLGGAGVGTVAAGAVIAATTSHRSPDERP